MHFFTHTMRRINKKPTVITERFQVVYIHTVGILHVTDNKAKTISKT